MFPCKFYISYLILCLFSGCRATGLHAGPLCITHMLITCWDCRADASTLQQIFLDLFTEVIFFKQVPSFEGLSFILMNFHFLISEHIAFFYLIEYSVTCLIWNFFSNASVIYILLPDKKCFEIQFLIYFMHIPFQYSLGSWLVIWVTPLEIWIDASFYCQILRWWDLIYSP
jgi:hypothetical protein